MAKKAVECLQVRDDAPEGGAEAGGGAFDDVDDEALFVPESESMWRGPLTANREVPVSKEAVMQLKQRIQRLMWNSVGIIRYQSALETASEELADIQAEVQTLYSAHEISKDSSGLRNIAAVALAITHAAAKNHESIGTHQVVMDEVDGDPPMPAQGSLRSERQSSWDNKLL